MPGGGEPPASAFSYDAYRRFWVGTFAAVFGERFRFIAGLWLVVEITDSPFWLGVVALVQAVPTVLLSVPAGALADRIESRAILGVTYAAIGVSHLTIALLTTAGVVELWMVIVWSMTVGSLASGSAAAQNVLIPRLVERRAMASAVAESTPPLSRTTAAFVTNSFRASVDGMGTTFRLYFARTCLRILRSSLRIEGLSG